MARKKKPLPLPIVGKKKVVVPFKLKGGSYADGTGRKRSIGSIKPPIQGRGRRKK